MWREDRCTVLPPVFSLLSFLFLSPLAPFSKKLKKEKTKQNKTTMPTSILHTLSSFLQRRYNLSGNNNNNNSQDRESLAREIAHSLKHIPAKSQQLNNESTITTVEDGIDNPLETTLEELDEALNSCELSLLQFEKRERFLYVRIERYRELIRGSRECCVVAGEDEKGIEKEGEEVVSNNDNDVEQIQQNEDTKADKQEDIDTNEDVENDNKHNASKEPIPSSPEFQQKLEQDQKSLQDVETIHADIIAQIETLKRRIIELAEKKQDILIKREECHEFLVEFAEGN